MDTIASMKAEDWVSIIVAVIGFVGTVITAVITSFHVKPVENIEKIVGNIDTLQKLKSIGNKDDDDRKERAISNLWECVEHESEKLSPYPGWFGYLLAMWFVVSCVSSYFANDVNRIAATILISFIAIVFLCAFLWVFPRCKWGSETGAVSCACTFICGTIGTWIGGYEWHQLAMDYLHQLAKANNANPTGIGTVDTICGLIGPGNVDAIGGLIYGLIGGLIGAAIGAIIVLIIGKGIFTWPRMIGIGVISIIVGSSAAIAICISGGGIVWTAIVGIGAAIAVGVIAGITYHNVHKKNTLKER